MKTKILSIAIWMELPNAYHITKGALPRSVLTSSYLNGDFIAFWLKVFKAEIHLKDGFKVLIKRHLLKENK